MTQWYSKVGRLVVLAVSLVYLLTTIGLDDSFYPRLEDNAGNWLGGDEVIYYLNAKGFAETPALHDGFTFTGIGSSLSESGPYGPGYTVFRGVAMSIYNSPASFIVTNLCLLFICMVLIQASSTDQKAQKQLIILCYPFTWLYTFTFMQETISVFFAVALSLLAEKVLVSFTRRGYLILLLVFSAAIFFRPTWVLATLILLLVGLKWEKLVLNGLIIIGLFVEAYWVQTALTESLSSGVGTPAYHKIIVEIANGDFREALVIAYYNFKQNIQNYVEQATNSLGILYSLLETMPLILLMVFFLESFNDQRKKALASFIVLASIISVSFVLYEVCCWREVRIWGGPVYMATLLCGGRYIGQLRNLMAVASVVVFVFYGLGYQSQQISTRQLSEKDMQRIEEQAGCFNPISKIETIKDPMIFIEPEFFNQINLMALPLTLEKGGSIRYVLPLYHSAKKNYNLTLKRNNSCGNDESAVVAGECFFLCLGNGHHWKDK